MVVPFLKTVAGKTPGRCLLLQAKAAKLFEVLLQDAGEVEQKSMPWFAAPFFGTSEFEGPGEELLQLQQRKNKFDFYAILNVQDTQKQTANDSGSLDVWCLGQFHRIFWVAK